MTTDLTPGLRVAAAAIEWVFAQDCSNALMELEDAVAALVGTEPGGVTPEAVAAMPASVDAAPRDVVAAAVSCVSGLFDDALVARLVAAVSDLVGYGVVDGMVVDVRASAARRDASPASPRAGAPPSCPARSRGPRPHATSTRPGTA